MHELTLSSWTSESLRPSKSTPKSLSERLQEEAAREGEKARQLEGCTFVGEWPGSSHLRQQSLLLEAAAIAAIAEKNSRKKS